MNRNEFKLKKQNDNKMQLHMRKICEFREEIQSK